MAEKKIKLTADEGNVSATINRLKRDSEELGRGLIRDARAYTTSGKEALSYIEEQIKAIERRNRVEKQSRMLQLEAGKQRGQITQEQFKKGAAQVGVESKADTQQVTLLRELIETIKTTSKREIIEDRKGVEKQLSSDKQIDNLSPKGDELNILKKTLQRQQLGDVKDQERDEKEKFEGVRRAGEAVNRTGGIVAGSQNQFFMAAAVAGMVPVLGGAISALMQRALGSAQSFQTARGGLYGMTGGTGQRGQGGVLGATGTTYAEFYELQKQTAIAKGGGAGAGKAATDVLLLEKLGIGRNLLLEQEKLGRGGASGSRDAIQGLTKGLQATGAIQGQDFTLLGEYFDLSLNLQREQLRVSGETNDNISSKLIAGITSMDESFKNPDVLKGLVPSLMGGLSRPSTPQAEAFQFGILRRLNPGATLSELQEQRESPTLEYFQSTMQNIKQLFPDEEIGVQVMKGVFGMEGQTKLARKLFRGDVDLSNYENQQGIINLEQRAGGSTGTLDKSTANLTRTFEVAGDNLTNVIDKLINENLPEGMKEFVAGVGKFTETVDKIAKEKWWIPDIVSPKEQIRVAAKVYKAITED